MALITPEAFVAEWKWDGIRVQAVVGHKDGARVARLFSRTGEDISGSFPDLMETLDFDGAIDGELLVLREGLVQSFNVLQQRLNRKAVSSKLIDEHPIHIRAYDLLSADGEDLRDKPFLERRDRLEAFLARTAAPKLDLSPLVPFETFADLAAARADPVAAGAGGDAEAVEGIMLKRRDSPYLPGRPKGHWFKWKRDPFLVDAVLMYAQRGHGKRSSFYSDYTFGVWDAEERLVPVGKAYFGFTDEELVEIDRYVRRNTLNRFGPVREVTHGRDQGLVFEVAFEGHRPLEPAQIRRRHAVSAHFAPALGQAAARGRPARHADADDRGSGLGARRDGGRARHLPGSAPAILLCIPLGESR